MEYLKRKPKRVSVRFHQGILIARIEQNSLVHELAIREVERVLMKSLESTQRAIIIDCEELRLQVSSQFMSVLVELHRSSSQAGIPVAVCGLSKSLRDCFEITGMSAVIPHFETVEDATTALGDINQLEAGEV